MTARRPLIAGNWKMNMHKADGIALATAVAARYRALGPASFDLLMCPPATLVDAVVTAVAGTGALVGGQDASAHEKGAHTGDTSAWALAALGATYVIVGHSERRVDHHETDAAVKAKAAAVLAAGLTPIICVGETAAERQAGETLAVVARQIKGSIPDGTTAEAIVIAYEPVWAIGTGLTPTTADVAEVHAAVRRDAGAVLGGGADKLRILYGGSVKPDNAKAFLSLEDVDGALVGGASLKADDFFGIASAVA